MRKLICLLCGICFSSVLAAQDFTYSLEKSFLLNAPEAMSVDELPQQAFKPYQYDLNLGFQDQPIWLRFDIKPIEHRQVRLFAPASDSQIIVRLAPYQLDSVELYEPIADGWRIHRAGDRVDMDNRICPDDTHCVGLSSPADQAVTLFLKVKQRGIFSVRAEVLPYRDLSKVVAKNSGRNSASVAIAGSLLFMSLVLLIIERNMLLFTFSCFQALVVIFILTTTGRLQAMLPEMSPLFFDTLTHHLFSLRVLMFILLGWASLAPYTPSPRYKFMLLGLLLLLVLSNLMIQMGDIQAGIFIYLLVAVSNLGVQAYGILTASKMTFRIKLLLMFAYLVYMVVLIGALLVIFGQLMPVATANLVNSYTDWRTNGGPAGIIIFLIVIIQQAERKLAINQEIGKLRLDAATSQANQEKLTERQTLIDMLTHELKNPLGTIRFVLASLKHQTRIDSDSLARVTRMDRSVERMNELIEHVAHSNKIDRFELSEDKEWVDAEELIDEFTSDYQLDGRFSLMVEEGAKFHTYRNMLSVVIENLVNNAYKYDDRRVPISIKVHTTENATVFEIANSIDSTIRPDENKLFERYYRHDNVQSLPGMGIGLSLVETAAEKIGAKVSCEVENQRVAFTVEVPR